ncbi:MAG TPA: hypothetical protein VHS36_05945 [Candidatus Limnocylindrales bacterium]|nr:hypothetical protein [Candidatus Limnocylindrales bacterium]
MTFDSSLTAPVRRIFIAGAIVAIVAACGGTGATVPSPTASATAALPSAATSSDAASPADSTAPSVDPSASQEPDTGAGTATGDVPDNAVFLTYRDATNGFSIQYVEGWQVTKDPTGVTIRDKDSSEVVQVGAAQTDVASYVSGTDLPALRQQAGFKLVKQDTVKVGARSLVHLVYDVPSPPDPVTGKQVPSTVDRYYVPGPSGLATVSLSTPKGVDNVDAFRQMIESFKWA